MVAFVKFVRFRILLGFIVSGLCLLASVDAGHAQSVTVSNFRLQSDGTCGAGGSSTTFLANALGPTGPADGPDAFGDPVDWIAFYLTDSAGVILGSATFNAPPNSYLANDFFGTVQQQPTATGNFTFYVYDIDTNAADQSIGATYAPNGRQMGSGSFNAAALDSDCSNISATGTPPAFSAAFSPSTIDEGNISSLTFTINNAANSSAATGLDFTNNLPAGVTLATPANASTTCTGGTLTATSGASTISYSGGTVGASASCTISVDVTSPAGGSFSNTSGSLTSSLGNSGTASATLTVTAVPPTVTIGALSGPSAGVYTAQITLSEASTDFVVGDLTLTNATATLAGSGTSYTATLTPLADGQIALSVAAGKFTDAAGNDNTASNEVTAVYDGTPPTVTIGALSGPSAGVYTAQITLSEASTDFVVGDLTLTNASATLAGSGTSYTATLTPLADGQIALSVAAGKFTDAAGNDNTASNEVTAVYDGTPPTVSITDAPGTVNAMSSFTVTITFSEDVTGFDSADINATNATVSSLTGSGAVYQAQLTASGSGAVSLVVPEDVAFDAANNGNLASNTVSIADVTVEQTQELIASFMQTRANHLIRSQPGLSGFLSRQAQGGFGVNVTRGQGQFNFASNPEYPIWMQAQGSWSSDTTSESRYMFGALGTHRKVRDNLLIGMMVQFDHLSEDTGAASVDGTGWMAGPYFVAKSAQQPVFFEGRLLYGETSNTISPFGTYEDDFDTTRMLAQFKVTGEYAYGSAATLYPFFDASYVTDDQKSYVDSLGNRIPKQGISLGQIEFGLDFKREIPVATGELELWGGVSGIWSHSEGDGFASTVSPDYDGGRARIELGVNRMLSSTRQFNAATFYDGIGASGFESFGVSLGYEMQF
ncbi:Ig-like domain-containing protein [Celeribacter ethanolicus]|uniref:Ig-like domain-containing protein n=1 Tax=Celeribacter ethanolicus TaxID=1758178 RepID=UPI0012FDFA5E|nr:Ig-like domain-containing protein [Celeribacter ethanolicus]